MRGLFNIFGIGLVWVLATVAWMVLGGVTGSRRAAQDNELRTKVSDLWGEQQTQRAPRLTYRREYRAPAGDDGGGFEDKAVNVALTSSKVAATVHSDPRRKGLMWYALYDVTYGGEYSYVHAETTPALLTIEIPLPSRSAVYDDLVFMVDGVDRSAGIDAAPGTLTYKLRVAPQQRVTFVAGYRSRGMDEWRYLPSDDVSRLNDFELALTTDFTSIDFPAGTLSPSSKTRTEKGWKLTWNFRQIVTGQGMGMVMPDHIQPGELAASLSFSAPVSLLFFFVIVFVLSTLRNIDVHPINYLLIAAAFFAFHLLFAYLVDHLPVEVAFAICSVVSLVLVVSYMRLVISNTFAFREAAVAQLIFLVGFSLAHFWEGFTGLTITIMAIVTLFVMMQLTGRIRWHEVLRVRPLRNDPPGSANAASAA